MALPKLPCEYKELGLNRTKSCFGDLCEEDKNKLLAAFEKCAENLAKLRYDKGGKKR